jgi:uncharacterized protein YciI
VVVRFRAGPAWADGRSDAESSAHRAFVDELGRRGAVVFDGPFTDGSGAMLVLDGVSSDDARRLIDDAPLVKGGVLVLDDLREWAPLIDNSSPRSRRPLGRHARRGRRLRIAATVAIGTTISFLAIGVLAGLGKGHANVAAVAAVFMLVPASLAYAAWRYITPGFLIAPLALPGIYGLTHDVERYTEGGSPAAVVTWAWVTVGAPLAASVLFVAAHLYEQWAERTPPTAESAP